MGGCSSKTESSAGREQPYAAHRQEEQRPPRRPEDKPHQRTDRERENGRHRRRQKEEELNNNGNGQRRVQEGNNHRREQDGNGQRRAKENGHHNDRKNREQRQQSGDRTTRDTVDFQEFKDDERSVVETMLANNRGLRMAEINFKELKLEKVIGAGAFGEVIKGTYCGTPVVVKRMLRNKINEDNLSMFSDEIQLMMNLRHPNVVQFIGASWNSYSNICFVTEFLERGDLFGILRKPEYRLTWEKPMLRMTIDTARGMAYLHSMRPPIIHRDLKSMNILVSSTWTVKVSDFGLSREKSVDETMSVTGTPLWLPPEMIRGERYTEKADVYSFGIVLSEMDTRKIPYHDVKARGARNKRVSGSALMNMVAYENLRPSLSPNCMDSIRDLYVRCTADDQSKRPTFESIVEFLDTTVRQETKTRANEQVEMQPGNGVSPEELGVHHAVKYTDD